MSPRMKDIAEAAGVDIGTVSYVLNNRPKAAALRPETRERIRRIAAEMGYCRDEFASSVATRHSNVLAFITVGMGDVSYTGRIQNGILDAASARNFALSIYHLARDNQDEICRKLIGWRTAGAVFHIASLDSASGIMATLTKNGIPFATANLSNPGGMGVTTDDARGIRDVVALFKRRGAKKPVFLTLENPQNLEYLRNRETGFRQGMSEFYPGVKPEIVTCGSDIFGMKPETPVVLKKSGIDSAACSSDDLALYFQQLAQASGFRIPRDFLLTGFGGIMISAYMIPSITTVLQGFEEIGRCAAELVLSCAEQEKSGRAEVVLPVKILERRSTGEKT